MSSPSTVQSSSPNTTYHSLERAGRPALVSRYNLPYAIERPAIIDHFKAESKRLSGTIRQDAGNRLISSVLREDAAETGFDVTVVAIEP